MLMQHMATLDCSSSGGPWQRVFDGSAQDELRPVAFAAFEAHSSSLFHSLFHMYTNYRVHDPSCEIAKESGRAQQSETH